MLSDATAMTWTKGERQMPLSAVRPKYESDAITLIAAPQKRGTFFLCASRHERRGLVPERLRDEGAALEAQGPLLIPLDERRVVRGDDDRRAARVDVAEQVHDLDGEARVE